MAVRWTKDGDRFRVTTTGGIGTKLIALPFFAIAAWSLWRIGAGFVHSVRRNESLVFPLAMLVLFLVTAIPGWLIVAARRVVTIDRDGSRVDDVRDFRVAKMAGSRRLQEFRSVRIAAEMRGSPGRDPSPARAHCYPVYLQPKNRSAVELEVAAPAKQGRARALSEALADFASLAVIDESDSVVQVDPSERA